MSQSDGSSPSSSSETESSDSSDFDDNINNNARDNKENALVHSTRSTESRKVADVVEVKTGGLVHIGPSINITENVVVQYENGRLHHPQEQRNYDHFFTMVKRAQWLAQPSGPVETMENPAKYVIICHTATDEAFTQSGNVLTVRLMQTFHIDSRGWTDIAYNFCIGSDGNVYEGRGWRKVGKHSLSYNPHSIAIAFVGCFLDHLPPKVSLKRCHELIEHGVNIGAISPNYELLAHCQCTATLSPGMKLFEEVKTWKNFNPKIQHHHPCILESKYKMHGILANH